MLGVGVGYSCCLNFVSVPKRTTISLQYYVKGGMEGGGGVKVASTERRKILFVRAIDKRNTEIKREREREREGGEERAETEEETDKQTETKKQTDRKTDRRVFYRGT